MIRKVKGEPGILEYHKGRRAGRWGKQRKLLRRKKELGGRHRLGTDEKSV